MDLRYNKSGQHTGREPLPSFVVKSKNPQNKNNFRVTIKGNKDLLDGLLIREYLASSMETIGLKDTHLIKGVVGKNLINSQLHIINK